MKDDIWKMGFADRHTDRIMNEQTDFCECRVAFATENAL